jgi:hypothetical protein
LIVRFAHHHALNWNLSEENTTPPAQRKTFGEYVEALTPYNHPLVIHSYPNQKDQVYDRLSGAPGYVFADPSEVVAAYLKARAADAILTVPPGSFDVQWFNPRSGDDRQTGSVSTMEGGSTVNPGAPPATPQQDWVVKLTRIEPTQVK